MFSTIIHKIRNAIYDFMNLILGPPHYETPMWSCKELKEINKLYEQIY